MTLMFLLLVIVGLLAAIAVQLSNITKLLIGIEGVYSRGSMTKEDD